jgi:polysaccharide biosynthesis/export protein VpsN
MNLLSKLSLFGCAALLAGTILSGCSSTDEPLFSDNPNPPPVAETANPAPMTETSTNDASLPSLLPAEPRLQAGETVIVSTTTGSDSYPGPIPVGGQNYLIAEDGTITLPFIGTIQAAGKAPGELQDEIQNLYVPQYYIRLTVTVTAQNRVYYVGGEVAHPGAQVYVGETTVSKAIQAAGDLTQFANHKVWLNRADGTRIRVNVDKALRDATADPPVFPGDQIQVPRRYF